MGGRKLQDWDWRKRIKKYGKENKKERQKIEKDKRENQRRKKIISNPEEQWETTCNAEDWKKKGNL